MGLGGLGGGGVGGFPPACFWACLWVGGVGSALVVGCAFGAWWAALPRESQAHYGRLFPHRWPGVGRWSHLLGQNLLEANVPVPAHDSEAMR